ncbi:MAG: hypothetical protein AMJ84_04735 [Acidithiobacillales bacterium SM23_46]|nr:MAG: hypothetical protein AMS22_09500 [Thiotrichales bacterium SG8_50]KPK72197.1 MAG: hypothetical protein AMJ84_04735 [Acidithiobacillales bacterium SM23_46]KPL27337.1 MAG: hypothetical protein AMJ72_09405 [Acidithiobacillales bacterium SM1_46]
MKRLVHAIGAALVLTAGYLGWYWFHALEPGSETFVVKPGMSLKAFARELNRRGVLHESQSFVLLANLLGKGRELKTGEYLFDAGISARGILAQVVAGRVVRYPVVLVEGWTFRQFLQALARAEKLTQTLAGQTPGQIMAALGHPDEHPEGRFFPDTYHFTAGDTDRMVLARAYQRMQDRLEQEWNARAPDLPVPTPYEALILASIVEKETGKPEERSLIAGVFVNRLHRGMRLQTDPTVIYGLGERFDGNLRRRDLERDTPYNTYKRTGLPPTPIAMPGAAALRAALHPAETRALYFVSRGDGSHVFSETLSEHNAAVIKYQLHGRPRDFSSYPARAGAER